MNAESHLTAEQSAGYLARTLEPAALLAVDHHLGVCEECRTRLFGEAAPSGLAGLRTQFSEHLPYEQVEACAHGRGSAIAVGHLRECAACREEVEDLRRFRDRVARKPAAVPRWAWVAAATVVVASGLGYWYSQRSGPSGVVRVERASPAGAELTPEQQEAVRVAMAERRLPKAAVLDGLVRKRGVLLGDADGKGFELRSPVGTVVLTGRPTFRWEAVPGAQKYVVSVYDPEFRLVVESSGVASTEWQPDRDLPAGVIYVWQVTASVGGETSRAPVPPAPEARFQVAAAGTVAAIGKARRDRGGDHLAMAVLLAREGALDEASAELDAPGLADKEIVRDLRDSLVKFRK